MTAHRRASARERQAAELLGTRRVHRSRYESAPDVEPVTLRCGVVLSVEVKTRKRLPALLVAALAQAKRYGASDTVPAAVVSATGGEPLIVLPLRAFRRIVGLDATEQSAPLGSDELRVLEAIRTRLRMGATVYGPLDVRGDPRDWTKEAAEEALDLAVYLAASLLRGEAAVDPTLAVTGAAHGEPTP